ncbi:MULTISPECIES: sodium:proton antiporter [Lactobacillaceae]|uniref:cation:proton antiporter n=1 Tax=Lactobacillaceae TaxID=33958 RepID=UPI001456DD45|nr:sodium:proton antiporter [Lactobacillus sp. HBUAS51381]NLR10299.1 sodium:proton antiporter [Lactobacillus sp. HBUAS51381]
MKLVFLVLMLLLAVIGGHVLSQHCPRIPQPFFLMGLGLVFAFFPLYQGFQFSPDVFTFAIIAPLMYNESENVSRYWVGRGIVNIFSLAIVLVILTVLLVGVGVHGLFPIFPLSLAFALCAVVTPTDASAVSAITPASEEYRVPQTILRNESLFNDASGIVAFDLALATYISGKFAVSTALLAFGKEFLGGLLLGAILGLGIAWVRQQLIHWGDNSPMVLVTIELVTPFILYYLADELGLSGILAVVAAGLIQGAEREHLRLTSSRMQLVSANVWEMINGILSSLVFVLLGISLPRVLQALRQANPNLWWRLTLAGAFIYGAKFFIRLIWSRYFVWMHKPSRHRWMDSWLMALSGANGTITLALAFSLPLMIKGQPFALRSALIFTATVVILLSLLTPTLVLPRLLKTGPTAAESTLDWNRRLKLAAMSALTKRQDHPSETQIVLDALRQQFQGEQVPHRRQQRALFRQADAAERQAVTGLREQGSVTEVGYTYYLRFLRYSRFTVDQRWWKNLILRIWFSIHMGRRYRDIQKAQDTFMTSPLVMEQLYWQQQFEQRGEAIQPVEEVGYQAALTALQRLKTIENRTAVDVIERYYHERHRRLSCPSVDPNVVYQLFLAAFHTEYECIQETLAAGEITAAVAEDLQQQIVFDEMSYLQNRSAFLV